MHPRGRLCAEQEVEGQRWYVQPWCLSQSNFLAPDPVWSLRELRTIPVWTWPRFSWGGKGEGESGGGVHETSKVDRRRECLQATRSQGQLERSWGDRGALCSLGWTQDSDIHRTDSRLRERQAWVQPGLWASKCWTTPLSPANYCSLCSLVQSLQGPWGRGNRNQQMQTSIDLGLDSTSRQPKRAHKRIQCWATVAQAGPLARGPLGDNRCEGSFPPWSQPSTKMECHKPHNMQEGKISTGFEGEGWVSCLIWNFWGNAIPAGEVWRQNHL